MIKMHGMDRENKREEMNIYANADNINHCGVRTERENTRRDQTPQHTGSDCVMMRSSRAALVCLVLLCFLLLTAFIVLSVLIYTKHTCCTEREELLTKIKNLTEEKDKLQTRNMELITKRDELCDQKKKELSKMDEWIYYQSSLYFISSEKKSWTESRRYCSDRGADLIIINNKQEQEFVNKRFGNQFVWIGLTDTDTEDEWKWVDGSELDYNSWRSGEPSASRVENCVLSDFTWIDHQCEENNRWVCEKNMC